MITLKEVFKASDSNHVLHGGLDALEDQVGALLPNQFFRPDHQTEAGTVNESNITQIESEFAVGPQRFQVRAGIFPNLAGIGCGDLPMPDERCDSRRGSQSYCGRLFAGANLDKILCRGQIGSGRKELADAHQLERATDWGAGRNENKLASAALQLLLEANEITDAGAIDGDDAGHVQETVPLMA